MTEAAEQSVWSAGSRLEFLRRVAREAREHGKDYVQIVTARRGGNSPRNWDNAQVVRGLFGRCIGAGVVCGTWIIDTRVDAIEKWLEREAKRLRSLNGWRP